MSLRVLAAALFLGVAATATLAEDACPLDYMTFEVAVPHSHLEACPAGLAVTGAFCRVSLNAETATVFAFSDESLCLLATRSYHEGDFAMTFGADEVAQAAD